MLKKVRKRERERINERRNEVRQERQKVTHTLRSDEDDGEDEEEKEGGEAKHCFNLSNVIELWIQVFMMRGRQR